MKKIAMLSTGGTIASKVDKTTGKLMAGEQTGEELLAACNISDLGKSTEVTVHSVFQVPSNRMRFENNLELLEIIRGLEKEGYEGYVITHGTDTMEESAYFLSLLWEGDHPIVFTGSQFSPTDNNTDAYHNIANALLTAACADSLGMGVMIAFNDRIYAAEYVEKVHASNIAGFASPRSGPIGIVDFGKVHYFTKPLCRTVYQLKKPLPKVEIVREYMNMDASVIDYFVSNGTEGIIVEGFGRGHTEMASTERLKEAMKKGVIVVDTTVCPDGEVAEVYGYIGSVNDLMKAGAINGHDCSGKKARIKLMVLLASGIEKDGIQAEFDRY